MIVKKLIEKVEGEAELDFVLGDDGVEDVGIRFGFSRGIETILVGKPPRDALVITPRVCGICNHAHLIASVRAIEDGYRKAGIEVGLSRKSNDIREFTLACELIQNHIKWLYLSILPQLKKLLVGESEESYVPKASYLSSTITKALAIFAGQWPHSSYAIPGGVTCDPTYVDIVQAESLIDASIKFFEEVVTGVKLEELLSMDSVLDLQSIGGDFGEVITLLERGGFAEKGKSHGRFIVFGECLCFKVGKSIPTQVSNIDTGYIKEEKQKGSMAKGVSYKNRFFEVGPLARAMIAKEPMVKALHKRYGDTTLTRVFARIYEVGSLLSYSKQRIQAIDLSEPSCNLSEKSLPMTFEGVGVVEAARGSLVHRTSVKNGLIVNYEIIVPTQWNLSNGSKHEQGVAVKAMMGLPSTEEASFVFRTFDVCSVCTTQ